MIIIGAAYIILRTGLSKTRGETYFKFAPLRSRGELPKPDISSCEITSRIIVTVQIDVDQEGNVLNQPRVIESTYQDDCLYAAVIRAAKKTKFTEYDKFRQRGWIRYVLEP